MGFCTHPYSDLTFESLAVEDGFPPGPLRGMYFCYYYYYYFHTRICQLYADCRKRAHSDGRDRRQGFVTANHLAQRRFRARLSYTCVVPLYTQIIGGIKAKRNNCTAKAARGLSLNESLQLM
ncbi:hypothetical protein EYZ11_010611 [Aspergillus tanneri]|uniref:Uncharacterized protein n=1 Tax=Aspergillus tanneri TaxID=1220188 RepID=A0A4S3J4X4_9EURO|nr:hypothetical protein EYZ11_010611 [Aspergillus tanneri]